MNPPSGSGLPFFDVRIFSETGLRSLRGMMLSGSGAVAPAEPDSARRPPDWHRADTSDCRAEGSRKSRRCAWPQWGRVMLAGVRTDFAPAFVVDQEESLVFANRARKHAAELVAPQLVLGLRWARGKSRARPQYRCGGTRKPLPWNWLVPLLMATLACAPEFMPYSAE